MRKNIFICNRCKTFTLKKICPNCSNKTVTPKPAKYHLGDKYGIYRRKAKLKQYDMEN